MPSAAQIETDRTEAGDNGASTALQAAGRIADLIAGRLDPGIDADGLFVLPLATPDAARTRFVLAMIDDDALFVGARRNRAILAGLSDDQAALALAQAEFLRLPAGRRQALLEAHRLAVDAREQDSRRAARAVEERARLERIEAGLTAFLAGRGADPGLLSVDALGPDAGLLSSERRAALAGRGADAGPGASGAGPPAGTDADALRQRIDILRARILALSPGERERLLAAMASSEAAGRAGFETNRLFRSQYARLMRVRMAQARAEAAFEEQRKAGLLARERALGWRRQVSELLARPHDEAEADQLYFQLVDSLQAVRHDLRRTLDTRSSLVLRELAPPELDTGLPAGHPQTGQLAKMRETLVDNLIRMRGIDVRERVRLRDEMYFAMTEMNKARLRLLPSLSSNIHAQLSGLGQAGLAQIGREVDQMVLTIRYTIAYAPQRLAAIYQALRHPTPGLVISLLQILVAVMLFRVWRRRGDGIVILAQRASASRQPPTLVSTGLTLGFGYLRAVRRPLDWLLLLIVLWWLFPDELDLSVFHYLWIVAGWILFAIFMVQLLGALARGRDTDDPRAGLRHRSLRLVAGTIVAVGLVLSLARESTGEGVIFGWVIALSGFLLIPVALVLASWWRERIVTLAQASAGASPILRWSALTQDGLVGNVARVIAGLMLLLLGARAIALRRVGEIALIRELADQRRRVRAAARVVADEESGRFSPVTADILAVLDPHRGPSVADPAHRQGSGGYLPEIPAGAIVALVGERGLGKTTRLGDLAHGRPPGSVLRITVDGGGFTSLRGQLAEALGASSSFDALKIALSGDRELLILVDDLQRLVVPAIGGLADFDALLALARATGSMTGWAFAMSGPAWAYLRRARNDQLLFDHVHILPRWDKRAIRSLIERRTDQAEIDPVFDIFDNVSVAALDADLTPEERTRRAYFAALADYSAGNPAVALEFWRRSLFVDNRIGKVVVRTYRTPDPEAIAALPATAHFVLRAILRMEVATVSDIQRSTDLSRVLVTDAVHVLARMGVVVEQGDGLRVTLFWYRDVCRLLERHNLLGQTAL